MLTTSSAGLLILLKRAFLKKSEVNIVRSTARISKLDSLKDFTMAAIACGSWGGSIFQLGTCGSSATKKLYR